MIKGFTLLETVIALAILGVASGALITVFSESLQRIRRSERIIQASALAQSVLARVEVGELSLSASSGLAPANPEQLKPPGSAATTYLRQTFTEGGLSWQIKTQPYGDEQDRSTWALQPQTVTVHVSWDDKKDKDTLALTGLILLPKSAP